MPALLCKASVADGRRVSKSKYLEMPAEFYHASWCGIDSRIEAVGLDHDTVASEKPIPNVREGASTVRVCTRDHYVV